ncbi:hypothetical protein [Rhizobium sp. CNPSo 4039]|nr:hypothetical protein [Rhizobium sp. CNPSo 4039]MDK4717296.1 hypothetical protein [Rhizobium sp. CNPSo 4039]
MKDIEVLGGADRIWTEACRDGTPVDEVCCKARIPDKPLIIFKKIP